MASNRIYFFLFTALFLILQTSCKTKKVAITNKGEQISKDSVLYNLLHPELPDWLYSKAKVSISDSYGSQKGNMYMIMKKDSVIWTSIKKLSIEGFRSQVNQDSAFFLNRLDKTYKSFSLDGLYNKYGLNPNLNYIQHLIAGLTPPIEESSQLEYVENKIHHIFRTDINNVIHSFNFDKETGWLVSGSFEDRFGFSGMWAYEDFRTLDSGSILPFKRVYKLHLSENDTIRLDMQYSDIKYESKTIKFKIPSHYTRI